MTPNDIIRSHDIFIERFKQHQEKIHQWLIACEHNMRIPLYSSVDIREAGFKMAVVDTNLFPGGFNNLCEHGLADAVEFMREAILHRAAGCKNILLIAEEHTRNTWYLENIWILEDIVRKAGFNIKTATFMNVQPSFCENARFVELETATQKTVRIYCLKRILEDLEKGLEKFCLIILNNDLSGGIPEILKGAKQPIYPSAAAGWHSRQKSSHFDHTKVLVDELATIVGLDPWLFSCLHTAVGNVNINEEGDRQRLTDAAQELYKAVAAKYKEHEIREKPYLVLKSDSGTYGMNVMAIEDPQEIIDMNRKAKNKLYKGKGSVVVERYLLQEGVPTIYNIDNRVSEVVIYQIENNLVGGFYRTNTQKSPRENLNASGMEFKTICPHLSKYGVDDIHADVNIFDIYRILARLAAIAASREIVDLEAKNP